MKMMIAAGTIALASIGVAQAQQMANVSAVADPYIGTWHQLPGKSCDSWRQGEPWEATFRLTSRATSGFYEGTYRWGECLGRQGGTLSQGMAYADLRGNLIVTFPTTPAATVYTLSRQGDRLVGTLLNPHGVALNMNMNRE